MTEIRAKSEKIRTFILENVIQHPDSISKETANHFNISRQAVNKHLQKLLEEKILVATGRTRKIYKLASIKKFSHEYKISHNLAEDLIWRNDIQSILGELANNVLDIWQYGFTEMLNNVIDHSGGAIVNITIIKTAINTEMIINDDGIGIFKKIQTSLNLIDERHALFELSKGKLTTDPRHHSGEGIFFTSRMFDEYNILSGGLFFSHEFKKTEDWLIESNSFRNGTTIQMKLNNHTARKIKKIFDQYSNDKNYGFNKTVVPVKLAQYGNQLLVSRSQAKRLLARIELFKIVIFDFKDVNSIGQAFADEIFRVFALQNPDIKLLEVNTNKNVSQMINRARINL